MSEVPIGCWGDLKRPVRYKRCVETVYAVSIFDVWNNPPTKAFVHYYDSSEGCHETSSPIKIRKRKNGTHYVQFENKRYNIDITVGNKKQYLMEV